MSITILVIYLVGMSVATGVMYDSKFPYEDCFVAGVFWPMFLLMYIGVMASRHIRAKLDKIRKM